MMRTLVKFDLSGIPSGSTVNKAYLLLYYYGRMNDPVGRTLNAYRVTKNWVETEATWNIYKTGSSWDTAGGDYTTVGGASSIVPTNYGQWMTWDVTFIVKAWIEDGRPNYGFIIKYQTEGQPFNAAIFISKEWDPEYHPILKVDWSTPTPTARPVGGIVMSTNKLEIVTPYIALACLVISLSTAVVVKRRK
ncbi:MAG: DNRLRE domain-containing protein [Candidatus Bathyarchaeia archaeon]